MVLAVGTAIGVPAPPQTFIFGEHTQILVPELPDLDAARLLYGTAADRAANGVSWRWDAEALRVVGEGDGGANLLSGTQSADVLVGGAGDDVLLGRRGPDVLRPGAGDDVLDGGDGRDVAVFESLRAESALDVAAGTVRSDFAGADRFSGVEELRFVEGRVTLDAAPLSNEAVTIGLYRVLLDAAPDPGGLAYWVMRMDAVGAQQVAAGIMSHHVYQGRVAAGLAQADLAPWTAVERAKAVAAVVPADGVWVPDADTMTLARMHHLALHGPPSAADLRADLAALESGASFALIGQRLLDRQLGTDPFPNGAALAAAAEDWLVVARFWEVAGARLALRPEGGGTTVAAIFTWGGPITLPTIRVVTADGPLSEARAPEPAEVPGAPSLLTVGEAGGSSGASALSTEWMF